MTLNSAVTDVAWSPNVSYGRPSDPQFIVIHHWGDDGQSHQNVVNWLTNPNSGASAHYVASDGRVTQLVHDYDRAWHAGPGGNPAGIGIECRPEMSDGDWDTVAGLISAIREEWGDLPLYGHRDFMETYCPGRWYPHLDALSAAADGHTYTPPTQHAPETTAEDGIWGPDTTLMLQAYLGTTQDGTVSSQDITWQDHAPATGDGWQWQHSGAEGSQVITALQHHLTARTSYTLDEDGLLGPETILALQEWLRVTKDAYMGADTVKELQKCLNNRAF